MMEVLLLPVAVPVFYYALAVYIAWQIADSKAPFRDGWLALRAFVGMPIKANQPKQTKGVYRWTGSGWLVVGLSKNGVKDYLDPARVIWRTLP